MIYSALTGLPQLRPTDTPPSSPTPTRTPTQLSHVPVPTRLASRDFDNWDSLLVALSSRLRSAVDRRVVLECADDLDLLHEALNAERSDATSRGSPAGSAGHDTLQQSIAEFNLSLQGQHAVQDRQARHWTSTDRTFG